MVDETAETEISIKTSDGRDPKASPQDVHNFFGITTERNVELNKFAVVFVQDSRGEIPEILKRIMNDQRIMREEKITMVYELGMFVQWLVEKAKVEFLMEQVLPDLANAIQEQSQSPDGNCGRNLEFVPDAKPKEDERMYQ